jgi:hypothetical protein
MRLVLLYPYGILFLTLAFGEGYDAPKEAINE